MGWSECMIIHIRLILTDIIAHYNLNDIVNQYGWIYMEIIRGMYILPQAGIFANNLLAQRLINHGYSQVKQTPGFCRHVYRPISFTFSVEYFGIGYVGQEQSDHLMSALKIYYEKSQ